MRLPRRRSPTTVRPSASADRRIDRAQDEGARQPDALEPLTDDAGLEGRQVRDDVG